MYVLVFNANITACCFRFTSPYQTFDCTNLGVSVWFVFFVAINLLCVFQYFSGLLCINTGDLFKANSKIKKSCNEFICYRNIAAGLISNMYIMALVMQTLKRATHTDYIIIRVRGEDDHSLWIRFARSGCAGIIRIWFTTGPACD